MTAIPTNNYVLCKQINDVNGQSASNGFSYMQENLPEYEIVQIDKNAKTEFEVCDIVISNSVPTKIRVDDDVFYLLNCNNIASKVV